MKIKAINENYYVEINKCGREGVSIEVGDVLGLSISAVVDKKELNNALLGESV